MSSEGCTISLMVYKSEGVSKLEGVSELGFKDVGLTLETQPTGNYQKISRHYLI